MGKIQRCNVRREANEKGEKMRLIWAPASRRDLTRLYAFLAPKNAKAAELRLQMILEIGDQVTRFPRAGELLEDYAPREVRHRFVAEYEVRYAIDGDVISILRIWHHKEDRPTQVH